LRLWTVGSSWFSSEDGKKGALVPGQLADLAVLSSDYFSIPDEEIKHLESVLTIMGGNVVYAVDEFSSFSPPSLPVLPEWAPVAHYGGYQNTPAPVAARSHVLTCAHGIPKPVRSAPGRIGLASLASGLWDSGCSCWAF
jgi:hypothetical protein